jgi:aspartate racemase
MKTIGLLGGMSWESTQTYYSLINREINKRLGGFHSAKIVLVSVDFAEIEHFQRINDWEAAAGLLIQAARQLEAGGADFIVICTNTMHEVYDQISASVSMPVLHIADAAGLSCANTWCDSAWAIGHRIHDAASILSPTIEGSVRSRRSHSVICATSSGSSHYL